MKHYAGVVIFGIVVMLLVMSLFKIRGCIHHNLYYKGRVERQIEKHVKPLEDRIAKLEKKLLTLER